MQITITHKMKVPATSTTISIENAGLTDPVDHTQVLSWLFQQMNRNTGYELISIFKLPCPSLSVGDTVEIDGVLYSCAVIGWKREKTTKARR